MAKKENYEVGYGKPPRSGQFRKGQSGNPRGRPRKEKASETGENQSVADLLVKVGNEEVEVGGKSMTLMEVQIRQLTRKACQGDTAASRLLMQMHEKAGVSLKPKENKGGGVLLVPFTESMETWAAYAEKQQAPFREAGYGKDLLVSDEPD